MPTSNKKKQGQYKAYVRYSSLAVQMGVTITLGVWGGIKLDEKYGNNETPIFTIVLSLLAVFTSLYIIIKEVIKIGKENE